MTVKEVICISDEQTRIDFPRGLGLHEAENLVVHLERDLPVFVDYTAYYSRKGESLEENKGNIGMTGTIISKKDNSISSRFYLDSQKNRRFELSGLKFIRTYDKISDYKPEVLQLWNDVRKSIDDFFKYK